MKRGALPLFSHAQAAFVAVLLAFGWVSVWDSHAAYATCGDYLAIHHDVSSTHDSLSLRAYADELQFFHGDLPRVNEWSQSQRGSKRPCHGPGCESGSSDPVTWSISRETRRVVGPEISVLGEKTFLPFPAPLDSIGRVFSVTIDSDASCDLLRPPCFLAV